MSSAPHVVQLEGLYKTFHTRHLFQRDEETQRRYILRRKSVEAARDISFTIQRGEVLGLLGPNGAGKTTTVKMISGLVIPDRGTVQVNGLDVRRHRRRVLADLGVVLEGTRTSIWPLTPYENLMYYGNLRGVSGRTLRERTHELLGFIGLRAKQDIQVRRLSRGEKQKLAICIALLRDPQLILLDEPTTGLDVQSGRAIKDRIFQMTRQLGKSVLVTTHDMHTAQEICDRIAIIDQGRLVACKPTRELLSVFSDVVFVFTLDRAPDNGALAEVPGALEIQHEDSTEGPQLVVRLVRDEARRSEALYTIIGRLQAAGYQLRGVDQRQQSLESVFLQLTTSTV